MAIDISNGIALRITDSISSSIPTKLQAIADNGNAAAASIENVQKQLNTINAAGISQLATNARTTASAVRDLQAYSDNYSNSAARANAQTLVWQRGLQGLQTAAAGAMATIVDLTTATAAYQTVVRSLTGAQTAAAAGVRSTATAASGMVSPVMAASASVGVLTGTTMGATRAAANFAVRVLGLGPILQAAFYVVGAIALVEILVRMAEAVANVTKEYQKLGAAARQTALDQALAAANGIQTIKPQTGTLELAARALKVAGNTSDSPDTIQSVKGNDITTQTVEGLQKQFAAQNAVLESTNRLNEAGLKSAALAKQKQTDIQAEIGLRQTQENSLTTLIYKDEQLSKNPNSTDAQQKFFNTQVTSGREMVNQFNTEFTVAQNNAKSEVKIGLFDAVKDGAKAAAAQMKVYEQQFNALKNSQVKMTPEAAVEFWQDKLKDPTTLAATQPAIEGKLGTAQQQSDSENQKKADAIANVNEKLQDQIGLIGLYSDAAKIQNDVDKDVLTLKKASVDVTQQMTNAIRSQVTQIVNFAAQDAALKSVYTEWNGATREYNATLAASIDLWASGEISGSQFERTINKANQTYRDAVDPMSAYTRELQQQIRLTSQTGTTQQMAVNNQVNQLQQGLQKQGFSSAESSAMANSQRDSIALLEQQKQAQADYNAILQQQVGVMQQLVAQQAALDKAYEAGVISQDTYKGASVEVTAAVAKQNEAMGNTSFVNAARGAAADYAKSYTNAATSIGKIYDSTFKTISDGVADSMGRSIAYADNFGKSLENVARSAVSELISSLIKLEIQSATIKLFGQTPTSGGSSMINGSAGVASGLKTLFAPNALASNDGKSGASGSGLNSLLGNAKSGTSLASQLIKLFSPSAGPTSSPISAFTSADQITSSGAAALESGTADVASTASDAGEALSDWWAQLGGLAFLADGGEVGGGGGSRSDSNRAMLSRGEYVINASSYNANKPLVQAINSGQKVTSSGKGMNVEVHNYSGVAVKTQQMDDNRVRMIIRDEAPGLVAQHAPGVIANDISNPNGATAKSINQNVTATRIR